MTNARIWVTFLVVGLASLVGAAVLLAQPFSRKPVGDYLARMETEGRPVTLRAALGPDPPAAENGAMEVATASKWADENLGDSSTWTVRGPWSDDSGGPWYDGLTDEQRRELDDFLAKAGPLFDGLAAGLAKPRMRETTPPGDGPIRLEGFEAKARIVKILSAKAFAATRAEDRLDATALLASLAVRTECRGLLDQMINVWAMETAVKSLRRELERGGADATAWRARLDAPLSQPWLPRFGGAVRLERGSILDLLRSADFDDLAVRNPSATNRWTTIVYERIAARLDGIVKPDSRPRGTPADLVAGLAATEALETAATDSYPRFAQELARITPDIATPYGHLCMVKPLVQCADRLARTDAATRLARIALAAAEHRAAHGDFPASLDELRPAFPDGVPLDPYTDAPFVYEKTADGVRIAAAGRLAGDPAPSEGDLRERVLVWELKR